MTQNMVCQPEYPEFHTCIGIPMPRSSGPGSKLSCNSVGGGGRHKGSPCAANSHGVADVKMCSGDGQQVFSRFIGIKH